MRRDVCAGRKLFCRWDESGTAWATTTLEEQQGRSPCSTAERRAKSLVGLGEKVHLPKCES